MSLSTEDRAFEQIDRMLIRQGEQHHGDLFRTAIWIGINFAIRGKQQEGEA